MRKGIRRTAFNFETMPSTDKANGGAEEIGESGSPLIDNDPADATAGVDEGLAAAAAAAGAEAATAPALHEDLSDSSIELLNRARSELNRLRDAGLDSGAFKYSLVRVCTDNISARHDLTPRVRQQTHQIAADGYSRGSFP